MSAKTYNVLFLCRANSARSIMAEMILNTEGNGHFRAYSAGSQPRGEVNPHVLELARDIGYPVETLRSKSWDEFAGPDAPQMDLIITLWDADGEDYPDWPGHPATARWGFPDPVSIEASEAAKRHAFHQDFRQISERIRLLLALPERMLDRMALQTHAREVEKQAE